MDNSHQFAAKMVVNTVTGNYINSQIPEIVQILEKPFVYVPRPFIARKPREDYSGLVEEIERKFVTLAKRNNTRSPAKGSQDRLTTQVVSTISP